MTVTYYPGASRAYDYSGRYNGSLIKPNCGVIHTTEGTSLPSYENGASAPNITAKPNFAKKRLDFYQHYPFNRSARALVNLAGGVETNTLNAIQIELVGTCDPKHKKSWNGAKAGQDYIYWPDAADWALDSLATFLAWQYKNNGVGLSGPKTWLAYPSSYGATKARMSHSAWKNFKGWCGHSHVPENQHGDPGDLDFAKLISIAKTKAKVPGHDGGSGSSGGSSGSSTTYTVKSGDTLSAIGARLGVKWQDIAKANGIAAPFTIKPGQKLKIPGKTTAPKPMPPFPGASYFGPGKNNSHITLLGKQLVKKSFGRHYTSGPGPKWTDADRQNVADFQRSSKELRGDPDGIPGPLTWRLLFS
ncbi:peptidoglycan-binding protein [Streptomyces sp. NRRL S-146]|uniref:peptidoglycan-binding protein n=1 Tax=Streptomyces sp. NRRL S-146 TaxID=1463884 RepID=UPI0004CB2F54|nr:peptidoglycan-binding protein [Streptomyces sp. NRRL S-146]